MSTLFFWNKWNRSVRGLYLFLLFFFSLSILFFIASYFIGSDAVIHWSTKTNLESTKFVIDDFSKSLINYVVEADTYLIKESFVASDVKVNILPAYIFFFFIVLAIAFILTLITDLSLFYYVAGMAAVLAFFAGLKLELLNTYGLPDKYTLIVLIILVGSISYYFHAFNKNISFLYKFLIFSTTLISFGIFLGMGRQTLSPVLYLANFGLIGPIIITIVFIVIIGFDILNGFLFLVTDTNTVNQKNRIFNFIIIALLYLVNVLFLLLKKMLVIDWDIVYLNPFLLYLISSILGIWAYRKRSVIFQEIIPFSPNGAFLYLGLGVIANATMAYAFITANDPLVEAFEYAIIYSQLGIGGIFFIYVLANFWMIFDKKVSIYKVVYQPRIVPFFMVRGIGGAIILSLFFYINSFPFYLGLAGYYNACADVYKYEKDYPLARQYYLNAIQYEFQNIRSNYSLASIAELQHQKKQALEYYTQSLVKYPSEYAYINLSKIYLDEDMFFPAMFMLKDGLQAFPKSGYIANNLALLYSKTDITDSTFYYFDLAKKNNSSAVPVSNLLAVMIQKNLLQQADSMIQKENLAGHLALENNKFILNSKLKKNSDAVLNKKYLNDSILSSNSFSYLYNYGLYHIHNADTATNNLLGKYTRPDTNIVFAEDLKFVQGLYLYYNHDKALGKIMLDNLKANSGSPSSYNRILGLWMLEQEAYPLAIDYFREALSDADQETLLKYCISLMESGRSIEAQTYLKELQKSSHKGIAKIAKDLGQISEMHPADTVLTWNEELKYQYIHFNKTLNKEDQKIIYNSFKNVDLNILAAAELMKLYMEENNFAEAENYWNEISGKISGGYAEGYINYEYLKLLAGQQKWTELKVAIEKKKLNKDKISDLTYFKARLSDGLNDKVNAEKNYTKALKESPFNEALIISAVGYYNRNNKIKEGYDLLVSSLELYPNSILLLKEYAFQSLKINLTNYAEDALKQLTLLMPDKEYSEFKSIYAKEKSVVEESDSQ